MRHTTVAIIGAPLDLGAGRRGVDMGVSALRFAGINERISALGYDVQDYGNIPVEQPERVTSGARNARYLPQIADACVHLAETVDQALVAGQLPVVLGGDHSVAVGTISGVSKALRRKKKRAGVLWIDAHADMNTPQTSPSGNIHGMPLACCIGRGPKALTHIFGYSPKVDPKNVALIGIRDVDELERRQVKDSGVRAFTMRDIDERGMRAVMEEAIQIALAGTEGIHVSFDMDVCDPEHAPGVGTPVRGGLSYREAHLAMEMIGDAKKVVSIEVVEVNPIIDEANRTALFAVELVSSAMGKRIL